MAKILNGSHVFDANTFISSADATSITFLSPGSINIAGVTSVIGSTSADTVNLTVPSSFVPVGFTLDTFSAFNFDLKNTSSSTTDSLNGTSANDTVIFSNSGIADMVNVRYAGNGGTDSLDLTAANDKLYLKTAFTGTIDSNGGSDSITGSSGVDSITLGEDSAQANWFYSAGGTAATDTLIGTSFADNITLTAPSKINYTSGGGADLIKGSSGADVITFTSSTAVSVSGGTGADLITLPTAAGVSDSVIFNSRTDSLTLAAGDVITNFQSGTSSTSVDVLTFNSTLQLGVFDYVGTGLMFTGGDNSEARAMQSGANTVIELDLNADTLVDMSITLLGVNSSTIDIGDFSFA